MNREEELQQNPQVVRIEGDPNIYLRVKDDWYYYNPDKPEDKIGEGAMGQVFKGYDYNTGARIAIKKVFKRYAQVVSIRERARTEASLSYKHPYLVEMIGSCECYDEEGWHIFILSKYIMGITLERHVKEQLANIENRVEVIAREICFVLDALQYLHTSGVVHRDIKPSNIMIEDGHTVKLMDLGIAQLNGGNKYSTYGFVGTPLYAPPEQILRDKLSVEINPSSDIYSLGITFYVLLAGSHPFDSPNETEVLTSQVTKKLPTNPAIPKRMMDVIWKATEKEQSKRYQKASDFKEAILQALEPNDPPYKLFIFVTAGVLSFILFIIILLSLI